MKTVAFVLALLSTLWIQVSQSAETPLKPNIIFVLSDDLAMGDLGCYGQKLIKTPHLDRMAQDGMRFTQAYCGTSVCAPSRASLMTGLHTGHSPIRANQEIKPEGQLPLPAETLTVAQVLKGAGYATAVAGKWGMGMFDTTGSPLKKGFDHFFGYNCQRHAHSYFPTYLYNGDQRFELPGNDGQSIGKTYAQNLIQEDVLKWVRSHKDQPFFFFYALTLPHGRHEIDDLGEYANQDWTPQQKAYAAQVTRLDRDVGQLLDLLKELKIDEKTLVFVAGDNGSSFAPNSEIGQRFDQAMGGKLRGFKRGMYEGALRQAALARWPGQVPAGRVSDEPWAFWDFLPMAADLAGAKLPASFQPDGISLVSFLRGGAAPRRPYFYWELHEQASIQAIRFGDWKAVKNGPSAPVELYDLQTDPGELKDVAAQNPELVKKALGSMKEARVDDPNWPMRDRKKQQPNIVVILSDDMGFSDIGCYGGEIATPNLDTLARNGLRFTQFYNTARCCPTRASLLTGLYPHQAGVGHMMEDRGLDGYRGDLNRRSVTIPEVLHTAGYRNYGVGKWHVTKATNPKTEAEKHNWPLQRGFDHYYGTIHGAGSYWDPSALVRDNRMITPFNDTEYEPKGPYYYTDAISDHAVRFIRDHARDHANRPFFLYVAYTAAHWPMHAKESDLAKYRGRYNAGYEAVRAARWARQQQMGLVDREGGLGPLAGDWAKVENKEFESRCMEVYAAMVDCMDQGIGRMVAELKQHKQLDNTLILFLQDNGGCAETIGRGTNFMARAEKPSLPPMSKDELQQGSIPKQTRDGYPVRQGHGVMPGPADTYIAYGREWANVSNTPFREYKHWVHEGGVSTPLIVHWPRGVASPRRGQLASEPSHLIDIMATCVDVANANYPSELQGEKIQPREGVSLVPLFAGRSLERAQPIFFEHESNRAVRDGQWKLVAKAGRPWELYDMNRDRSELNDRAAQYPERVKELSSQWEAWAARANVLPLGAWRGQKRSPGDQTQRRK